jgi:hypothetical protein
VAEAQIALLSLPASVYASSWRLEIGLGILSGAEASWSHARRRATRSHPPALLFSSGRPPGRPFKQHQTTPRAVIAFTASRIVILDPFRESIVSSTATLAHLRRFCTKTSLVLPGFYLFLQLPVQQRVVILELLIAEAQSIPLTARAALLRYRYGDSPIAGRHTPSSARALQDPSLPSFDCSTGRRPPTNRPCLAELYRSVAVAYAGINFVCACRRLRSFSRARCASSTERKRVKIRDDIVYPHLV